MKRSRSKQRWLAIAAASVLPVFTGCSDFFPPIHGGGSGGGSTSNRIYVANQAASSIGGFVIGTGTLAAVNNSPLAAGYKPYIDGGDAEQCVALCWIRDRRDLRLFHQLRRFADNAEHRVSAGRCVRPRHGCFAGRTMADRARWHDPAARHLSDQCIDGCADFGECSNDLLDELRNMAAQRRARLSGWHADLCCARHSRRCRLHVQYDAPASRPAAKASALETHKLVITGWRSSEDRLPLHRQKRHQRWCRRLSALEQVGALNPVTGSPFAAGNGTFSVALDSTGTYVYAANRTDEQSPATRSCRATTALGLSLTALGGSPYTSGSGVQSIGIDSTNKYLLAVAVRWRAGSDDVQLRYRCSRTSSFLRPASRPVSTLQVRSHLH